jgi:lipoate synthase
MSPQLESAIAAIQPLSSTERQQVLNLLRQTDFTNLADRSREFWQGQTIEQLRAIQKTKPTNNLEDLVPDFWPEEDSIEEFLGFLQAQRQEMA